MSIDIIKSGALLTVFEIDPAYCDWLREYLGEDRFKLVPGDVMKTWSPEWNSNRPHRVLGNLPYNAASAIIAAFIESGRMADLSVFTVQDEMGQRMTAKPGGKDYSSFSVLCQTGATVKDGGRLSPGSFYPAPRVKSRIIAMRPGAVCGVITDSVQFRLIVRAMFTSRRKTLSNNIAGASKISGFPAQELVRDAFSAVGIDIGRRPETVSPGEWVAVANRVAASR